MGKLVYAVDCASFRYKIRDVNYWIVEANHDFETMLDNPDARKYAMSNSKNHLSLQECIDVLKHNDMSCVNAVILAHLSDDNSNATTFARRVSDETTLDRVFIADKGFTLDLN